MAVSMRAGRQVRSTSNGSSPKSAFTKTSVVLFLDHLEAGGRAKGTIVHYRIALTKFLTILRGRPASPAVVREFLDTYPSMNTRSVKLVMLRAWMRFLRKRGLLRKDPTAGIPRSKVRRRSYAPLPEEDFFRLREALGHPRKRGDAPEGEELQMLVTLLYYVGSRIQETLSLRKEDVQFDESGDYGTVEFRQRKGGDAGYGAFGPEVAAPLRSYLRAHPGPLFSMHQDTAYHHLVRAGRRIGIPGQSNPHRIRHAYITSAIEKGWHPLALQQQIGHSDARSTEHYYHPTRIGLMNMVKRANGNAAQAVAVEGTPRLATDGAMIRALMHLLKEMALQLEGGEAQ